LDLLVPDPVYFTYDMSAQIITELKISISFINKLLADPNSFYHYKDWPKKKFGREQVNEDGTPKYRHTKAPVAFLKFKQRELVKYLQKIELPSCLYGGVKNKNSIQNTLQHENARYFFTIDLKDFFSNINNNQVNRALRENGISWDDARIITKLCTVNRCLPQGAPTSSVLANIVFAPTARKLAEFSTEKKITFTAFVDDLTFSSKYDFSKYKNQILETIRSSGFYPNNRKIHYRHGSCEVTGLIIKKNTLSLEKGMLENLRNPGIKAYIDNVARQHIIHTATKKENKDPGNL